MSKLIRDHSAFLNSYSGEDEGLYDENSARRSLDRHRHSQASQNSLREMMTSPGNLDLDSLYSQDSSGNDE
jgi:hypothetical protein